MKDTIFNQHNAFALLKRISFPRLGGTAGEKKAVRILKQYLVSIGLKPKEETFKVQTYQDISASLEVLTPYHKRYPVAVVGNSGSTPPQGLSGELVHLTTFSSDALSKIKNKIVLIYNYIDKVLYQKLLQAKVKALIRISEPTDALRQNKHNDLFSKAYGRILSVTIGYKDALEIVHQGARTVRVFSKQKEYRATSRNIIATIRGYELPDEKVIICAHYDGVNKSPASVDNGGGTVTVAEFARYFASNPPKRTIILSFFGSEELGLKGSISYVQRHKKELAPPKLPVSLKTPRVRLVINVDVTGTVFGNNSAVICGSKAISNFVEGFAKEKGVPMAVSHRAYSSDNIPFNERLIPSISLNRASGIYGHTSLDNLNLVSADGLKPVGQFGLELVSRIVNAVEIPFDLTIPEDNKKFIYDYIEKFNPYYRPR
ncbi:MAG: M28 family metallopeptidase [Planctomycetota bacterium]|nr:M28 family metallopeptidase [Planctomycetota bacterium]MDI6788590.1 M28 family metallopeptidase [Planctomycetota bacterium]